jgi:DNA-binding transcriptional regulator YdaS (Cro superfamily)
MAVPNLKIGSWKVDKGLKLAIEAAGSARRLAAKLGVSQQAVQQWRRIPAERVIEVERLTPTRPLNFALALFAF